MHYSPDLLHQLTLDRQHELRAAAAARRLAATPPARLRLAHSLRRAADRLDAASQPVVLGKALPGRGC